MPPAGACRGSSIWANQSTRSSMGRPSTWGNYMTADSSASPGPYSASSTETGDDNGHTAGSSAHAIADWACSEAPVMRSLWSDFST